MSFESLPNANQQNHFNLLRLVAASCVIVSHAWCIAGGPASFDPLYGRVGFDLGGTAVTAFFAISGYFISLSFDRRQSNAAFIVARATRIIPGLLVVSLISAFILGPLLTAFPLSSYFASKSVWLYTLQNISIYRIMVSTLPGVFVHNPFPGFVNGSLWTLFFEVACYIGLFVAGIAGLLRRQQFVWMLLAWAVAYLGARYGPWAKLTYFAILSFPFVIGMTVYHFRAARILNGWIALALMATAVALGLAHHGVEELWSAATAYGVLCLGFTPAPALLAYNKAGDFSYGTYIYGFPVGQTCAALIPGIGVPLLIALSLPVSILCGALSWKFVEKPALELRKIAVRRQREPVKVA